MQGNVSLKRRSALGEETGEAPKPPAMFQPFIDKVGVPILWFGLGYLAATLMQKPRRAAT